MKTLKTTILVLFLLTFSALSAECKIIKIGIATNHKIKFSSKSKLSISEVIDKKSIEVSTPNTFEVEYNKHKLVVRKEGKFVDVFNNPIRITSKDIISCNGKKYRGSFLIIISPNEDHKITAINEVDLEEYLLSVVPSEMPRSWHKEALKAQTLAARSYAIGYLGRRKLKGYDLESTVEDQVYLGVSSENSHTSKAVHETKGEILVDENGIPLITLFHSSGGGYTDSIENIWQHRKDIKPSKHIQPKPDYDDKSPHFKWKRSFNLKDISKKVDDLKIGSVKDIKPVKRSVAGRVMKIKLKGSLGEKIINGEEFRMYLRLPSSKFNIKLSNGTASLHGSGYGHGLGLSQWGAKALAEKGLSYKQILSHYYNGAKIVKINDSKSSKAKG